MKKIAIFLVVSLLAVLLVPTTLAANDNVILDFRSEADIKAFASISTNNLDTKEFKDGAYEIVTDGGIDPYISINIKKAKRFEAVDYPVVRVNYKLIEKSATTGQLFFKTSTPDFTMGSPGTYTEYAIDVTSTDWQDAVVDMQLIAGSMWADTVETFRLDPLMPVEGDAVKMAVRYIGFFKTEKDARAFDIDKYVSAAPAAKPETTASSTETAATTPTTTAPKTADPGIVVAVITMALSAGAALTIRKKK